MKRQVEKKNRQLWMETDRQRETQTLAETQQTTDENGQADTNIDGREQK